jgi:hypothetical protein
MQYRVVVVTTKKSLCSETFMNEELEKTCNSMGGQGYVLVHMYDSHVRTCGGAEHAKCLVFAKP